MASDIQTLGILRGLRELGMECPRDLLDRGQAVDHITLENRHLIRESCGCGGPLSPPARASD